MSAEHQEEMNRLQENTAMSRFLPVLRGELRNLHSIVGKRKATSLERVGGTMVCVGAGPSLDTARPFLREARRAGVPVIAAAPAARALEWEVDVSVSVEPIGGARAVPPPGPLSCVALCSGADQWARADAWFTDYYPHNMTLARAMRAKPLWYPGNVGPAVVGLAASWGASRIILAGFDLAYTGGKAYAEGAPWAGTTLVDNGGSLKFEHVAERNQEHAASGASTIPDTHEAVYVPAWGGHGEATTTYDYYMQIESLMLMAQSLTSIELINATGGGAHVEGFTDIAWTDELAGRSHGALDGLAGLDTTTQDDLDAAIALIRTQHERIHFAALDEMEHDGVNGAWRNWLIGGGFPFASAMCLPDFVALTRNRKPASPDALKERYVVMQAVAQELGAWLG